jgi:hypothetical protein
MLLDRSSSNKLWDNVPLCGWKSIYIRWQKKNDTEVCLPTTYIDWLTDLNWLMIISFHPCVTYIYTIYDRHCKRAAKDPTKYDETMCKLGNPKNQREWGTTATHLTLFINSMILPPTLHSYISIHISTYMLVHCVARAIVLFLSLSLSTSPLRTMDYELVFEFGFWTWLMVKKWALGYNNFHHVLLGYYK